MSKNIVFPYVTFNRFVEEPIIKKLALFYDKIYVGEGRFSIISDISEKDLKEESYPLLYEKAVWDFLKDNEVVNTYPYLNDKFKNTELEAVELTKQLGKLFQKERTAKKWPENPTDEEKAEMKKEYFNHFFLTHDISIRLDTLHLRNIDENSEYYPSLRTFDTLKTESKKNKVIQFILNDIPEPDYSTSWDHIIEYRTDEEVRNKYLALTNWVNKVSNSNLKLSEIKEEYEYLYSEYMKQFKLHKMKYHNSKLEIILNSTVTLIANIASGNYVSSIKDLFQFNIRNANLLKEEASLPGKEVAYIHHTISNLKIKDYS